MILEDHVHIWAEYGSSERHVVWEQCRCGERTRERPTRNPYLQKKQKR